MPACTRIYNNMKRTLDVEIHLSWHGTPITRRGKAFLALSAGIHTQKENCGSITSSTGDKTMNVRLPSHLSAQIKAFVLDTVSKWSLHSVCSSLFRFILVITLPCPNNTKCLFLFLFRGGGGAVLFVWLPQAHVNRARPCIWYWFCVPRGNTVSRTPR